MSTGVRIGGAVLFLASLAGAGWWVARTRTPDYQLNPTRLFEQVVSHVRSFGVDSLSEAELFRRAAQGLVTELGDEYAVLSEGRAPAGPGTDPGGLGFQWSLRGGLLTVLGVAPLSPAWRAGLEPGDLIITIDGVPLRADGRQRVLAALAGPADSAVRIQARRPGTGLVMELSLVRQTPRPFRVGEPVDLGSDLHYLAIHQVGPGVAEVLERALRRLPAAARGVVLDLRGAAGGSLDDALALVDLFLPPGEPMVRVQGRDSVPTSLPARREALIPNLPLVVLVDGQTADGAELLAGALQDHDRALLIGQATFGRGLSQEDFTLSNGWVVRMSTVRWETPMGRPLTAPALVAGDDAEAAPRPMVATARGRQVPAGGGVVPDSLLVPAEPAEGWVEFIRALGPDYPDLIAALDSTSEVVTTLTPGFTPSDRDVALVLDRLGTAGARPGPETVQPAAQELARRLGDRAVLLRLGESAFVRRRMGRDPELRLALDLLRTADSPTALVLGR